MTTNPAPDPTDDSPISLCISGGGVRSASFALGVLAGLGPRFARSIQRLSTVSGGGYVGAALVQWHRKLATASNTGGPFQGAWLAQIRSRANIPATNPSLLSGDFVRLVGSYLPGLTSTAALFTSMMLAWLALVVVIAVLFGGSVAAQPARWTSHDAPDDIQLALTDSISFVIGPLSGCDTDWDRCDSPWARAGGITSIVGWDTGGDVPLAARRDLVVGGLFALVLGILVSLPAVLIARKDDGTPANLRWLALVCWVFGVLCYLVPRWILGTPPSSNLLLPVVSSLGFLAGTCTTFIVVRKCHKDIGPRAHVTALAADFVGVSAWLTVVAGALPVFVVFYGFVALSARGWETAIFSTTGLGLLSAGVAALNLLTETTRDRSAFVRSVGFGILCGLPLVVLAMILRRATDNGSSAEQILLVLAVPSIGALTVSFLAGYASQALPATYAEQLRHAFLQDQPGVLHEPSSTAPLVATFLAGANISVGGQARCVPFAMSTTGVGWVMDHQADQVLGFHTRPDGTISEPTPPDLDLARAAQLSGAAVSNSSGIYQELHTSLAIRVFNLSLGEWVRWRSNKAWSPPQFRQIRDLFGSMYTPDSDFVYLSDGGHCGDNLGLSVLLAERRQRIVAIDGECDPEGRLEGLAGAIRLATRANPALRIDLDPTPILTGEQGFVPATIHYGDGTTGSLLYIKTSITPDLPVPVQSYHSTHPLFPHEPTSDQFFDPDQFDAYFALGKHVSAAAWPCS